ncbi:MAG: hypothetical protein KGL39_34650 [Patescibacteria group bacterium]|nr:hypothetical protein [Patescibacteria group bacterium]
MGAAQRGSQPAQQYTSQTAQYGAGNLPIEKQAQDIQDYYQKQIGGLLPSYNEAIGQQTTGTTPVGEGNAQTTYNSISNRLSNLQSAEDAALKGVGYQLTGQNQAANAANAAAGQALQGQSLQQTGLANAGQLSEPSATTQQVGQGTTVLDANGNPIATTPVIAPVGTQYPYSVAPTTYQGQNATTFPSGTQQGGGAQNTPFTGGQAQGEANIGAQVKQNEATIGAAQFIQQKINNEIAQNHINPSSLTAVNFWNQWIQGQVSNPQYQNFGADMTDYAATIAPLLGYGGNITDQKTGIAQAMVPLLASGQTITQALDNLNNLALGKNAAFGAAGQSGNNPTGAPASSAGQTTVPGMSGTYYQDANGKWHAR